MLAGSLFTGCAGLDLGLARAGIEFAWGCEIDEACRFVLRRRFPDLPVYRDARCLGASLAPVELLVGGFPCQDLSQAGTRAGLDGERSALWYAMADCIRLLRPRYVLIENVPGLATKMGSRPGESALGSVVADLAEAGYVGSWLRLRASDFGAPHLRERIFVVACAGGGAPPNAAGLGWRARAGLRAAEGASGDAQLGRRRPDDDGREAVAWGKYEPAVRRWERILGRAAPRPTDDRGRLMPRFVEWMLGFPDDWTEGLSKDARLRVLGNSVQVQCGEAVGAFLVAFDKEEVAYA